MKLFVSACLLGIPCRYDGRSKPCEAVEELKTRHELFPFCPEKEGGLSTPRLPCELQGDRVICRNGEDRTAPYLLGAQKALAFFRNNDCEAAILKSKSPSCGKGLVYDGSFSRTLTEGDGVTACLFQNEGISVYTEEELEALIV